MSMPKLISITSTELNYFLLSAFVFGLLVGIVIGKAF